MQTIDYYRKRRKIALIALGGCCQKCWSRKELEIDHIDANTKTINLGADWYNVGWWYEVLTKCQLLCNKCHVEKSREDLRAKALARGFKHGSIYGFMKRKCPCGVCRTAQDAWNAERRRIRNSDRPRGAYKSRPRGETANAVPLKGTTERFEGANPSGAT